MPWSHSLGGGCDRGIPISAGGRCAGRGLAGFLVGAAVDVQKVVHGPPNNLGLGNACAVTVGRQALFLLLFHAYCCVLQWVSPACGRVCQTTYAKRIYGLLVFVKGAK